MNIAGLLTRAAQVDPTRPALVCGAESISYAELDTACSRLAAALLERGLSRGDRVALFMKNRPEYAIAMLGAFRAGLAVVPINAKLHPREVNWILANVDAAALITDSEEVSARMTITVGSASFAALLDAGDPGFEDVDLDPGELAWIFYTSGTTGFPKGAMLSHRNLLAMTMSCLADVCDFRREDVVLHPAPLSHGCGLYLLPALSRGTTNHLTAGATFAAVDVLELIERERITCISFMAPTQIVRLLDAPPGFDTSSLRCVVYGGGPIHLDHAREAQARFGPIFCQLYGQGEAPMTISSLRPEDHVDEALTSAGFVRTNVEVTILDGEILVRGDVVMSGYWRNPEATAGALQDGWLHTGDLGRFDDRGRLVLVDRKNDLIISGGSNIYGREVEDAVLDHPLVRDVCVFGIPDREWGERVVAAVVPVEGGAIDAADVIDFCKDRLASYKKPTRVEFVTELPRNAYGKVLRRDLREAHLARAADEDVAGS